MVLLLKPPIQLVRLIIIIIIIIIIVIIFIFIQELLLIEVGAYLTFHCSLTWSFF